MAGDNNCNWQAGWQAGWMAGWLDGWLVDWQANNRDQTHLKCRAKGERQNAHLNFMDELQQMEHCAACQKLLPKSVGCLNALPRIPGCEAEPIPDARRWWWRAIYAMIMTSEDGRCRGSRRRPVVLPTWCSLQSIEVNAATSCSVSRSFLLLALTVSFFLPLTLSHSFLFHSLTAVAPRPFSLCFHATPFSWKGKK